MNYGAPSFGVLLIVRLIDTVIWVGLPVLLLGALIWWSTRRRGDTPDGNAREIRKARLIGLAFGAVAGVVAVWVAPIWLVPVAVAAGYLAGVLNRELPDKPTQTGQVRVASLQPRTARRYIPLWTVQVAIAAAVLTISAPIVTIFVPPASYGAYRPFSDVPSLTVPGHQDSWPSPGLWIPLVVVAGGALVVGGLLIRRVLRLPAAGMAEAARRNAARTIAGTVTGIEILTLGAQLIFTSDGIAVPDVVGGVDYELSRILIFTGLGLIVAGIVVWCVLSWWRRGPAEPATVPVSNPQT